MKKSGRTVLAVGSGLMVITSVVLPAGAHASTQATTATLNVHGVKCTIVGTPGNDTLRGTDGDDVICGLGGDDIIHGGDGDDVLSGGKGDDVLRGGDGDDILDGGAGDDVVRGGSGDDTLVDDPGDDRLVGGPGDDEIVDTFPASAAPAPFTPAAGETNPKTPINVAAGVTMVSQSDAEKVPTTALPKAVSVTVAGGPVVDAKSDAAVQVEVTNGLPAKTRVTSFIIVNNVRVPLANQTTEKNGHLTLPALLMSRGTYEFGIQQSNGATRWLKFNVG